MIHNVNRRAQDIVSQIRNRIGYTVLHPESYFVTNADGTRVFVLDSGVVDEDVYNQVIDIIKRPLSSDELLRNRMRHRASLSDQ